jgi:hypothetical protein
MGIRARAAVVLAFMLAGAAPVAAQVGHDPRGTPYRDVAKGHTITAIGGYLSGDGGRFGIAPHNGPFAGIRYEIRNSSTLAMALQVIYGDFDRLIVDPFVSRVNRVSGPVKQSVIFTEASIQFNLTGGKTWHRLAPFLGATIGLSFPSSTPQDTSGFELGHKVTLAPGVGFRLFLTQSVHLRAEARGVFWKLNYPPSFTREPPLDPGGPGDSHAVITDGNVSEWDTSGWFQAGLGFAFSP